jgi:hypothetical protein
MAKEAKVYDYKADAVRDRLTSEFRKTRGESTVADLISRTGLPKHQVETEIRAVADEYGARLRVTESGELLYSFPHGMKSRYRGFGPSFKRFWKVFRTGAAAVSSFAFKIWIVFMLVGYFILFLALALLALAGSVAVSVSGNKDSRDRGRGSSGIGGFYLASRILDLFVRVWFYGELFKTPEQRYYERERRMERSGNRRPLYKAVFSFVFGDGNPNEPWAETEKKAVTAFIQANRGVMTLEEFMVLTGHHPQDAEDAVNRYLYEFEGSPEVTENGTIYYFFPALLRRKDKRDGTFGGSVPMKRLIPFSANPKKSNKWFCIFNGVNLAFGSYFLYNGATRGIPRIPSGTGRAAVDFYTFVVSLFSQISANPLAAVMIGLGAVPVVFAVLFYLVPFLRSRRLAALNEEIKKQNLRKQIYSRVWADPARVDPATFTPDTDAAKPTDSKAAVRAVEELAAWSGGNPDYTGSAFSFPELQRRKDDVRKAREGVNLADYELGGAVFDSDA